MADILPDAQHVFGENPGTFEPTDRPVDIEGGIGEAGAAQLGETISQGGQQVGQAGEIALASHDQMAAANGMQQFLKTKLALDQEAEKDQDYTTLPQRYTAALTKAADDAASGIVGSQARAEFQSRMRYTMGWAINGVQRQAYAKGIDAQRGHLLDELNDNSTLVANTKDDQTATALIQSSHDLVDAAEATGTLTHEEAAKYRAKWPVQMAVKRAETIASANPLGAISAFSTAPAPDATLPGAVATASRKYGVDSSVLMTTAYLESGANGKNLFQFKNDTAKSYGITDDSTVAQQADAAAHLAMVNTQTLTHALGRAPTGAEIYLAHQQGANGAIALIQNPDENAVDALTPVYGSAAKARAAITDNGGKVNMTAGQFASMWQARFDAGVPLQVQDKIIQSAGEQSDQNGTIFPKTGDWRDYVPPDERARLIHSAYAAYEQQGKAQAEVYHQQAAQAASKVVSELIADPSKVNPVAISADPAFAYDPKLKWDVYNMVRSAQGTKDDMTYGPGFYSIWRRVNAAYGSADKITDPNELIALSGPGGQLSVRGVDYLTKYMQSKQTPQGSVAAQLQQSFITAAKQQIVGNGTDLPIKGTLGDKMFTDFLGAALPEIQKRLAAGENPADLFNSKDPKSVWRLVDAYTPSRADRMADIARLMKINAAQSTSPADASQMTNVEFLNQWEAAADNPKKRQQLLQYGVKRGWFSMPAPKAAPASAPLVQ